MFFLDQLVRCKAMCSFKIDLSALWNRTLAHLFFHCLNHIVPYCLLRGKTMTKQIKHTDVYAHGPFYLNERHPAQMTSYAYILSWISIFHFFMQPVVLNCSHTFCSYCINQWKRRTNWCPICRTSITARNPIGKLDSFIIKFARRVGEDAEKKRLETIKEREGKQKF